MGIFSWWQYTKIIINAEKKFIRIWNYDINHDEKTDEVYTSIVLTVLFETAEQSGLKPNGFAKMISGIRKSSPLFHLISNSILITGSRSNYLSTCYGDMYEFYLSARKKDMSALEATVDAAYRFSNTTLAKQFKLDFNIF